MEVVPREFHSKVLLFGEYSVIKDSMALSTPYNLFQGRFIFPSHMEEKNRGVDGELKALSSYLKKIQRQGRLPVDMDLASFDFDIGQGLAFNSSIPQGFGVGSSGALCAAVLDRYAQVDENLKMDVDQLRRILALIESHFHGSSSGIDPLISYLNKPILKNENGHFEIVKIPEGKGKGGLFLLNTGRARKTEPLVNLFLEKCQRPEFNNLCIDVLLPLTNHCIKSFLSNDLIELEKSIEKLSAFQFDHFKPMIPKLYQDLWEEGLDNEKYTFKLCGAGGGGFLLGHCQNFVEVSELLRGHELRPLVKF